MKECILAKYLTSIIMFMAVIALTTIISAGCSKEEKESLVDKNVIQGVASNSIESDKQSIDSTRDTVKEIIPNKDAQSLDNSLKQVKAIESIDVNEIVFSVEASSIFKEKVNNETVIYNPLNISDNDFNTAWVEGSSKNGVGEWLSFNNEQKFDLDTIQLANGYSKNDSLYYKNNRIAKIEVVSENAKSKEIKLEDGILGLQELEVGFKNISSVKIIITDIFEGTHYNDLCVSEIRFNNKLLNLILNEDNEAVIQDMEQNINDSKLNSTIAGVYCISNNGSGFYDENFALVEKYVDYVQVARHFILLDSGRVGRYGQGAGEPYYTGTWTINNKVITINNDYGDGETFFLKDKLLFKKLNKDQYLYYDFKSDNIVYEGLSREPLSEYNYPLK